jgi:tetratricopeptide (TPR) repeat protein
MSNTAASKPTSRRRIMMVLGVLLVMVLGAVAWWDRGERIAARKLLDRSRWKEARARLSRLVWLHPTDSGLRLMWAEAYARDDSLPARSTAERAVAILQEIPDDVAEGLDARIREARLRFLLLRQPMQAERLLRRALTINSQSAEALALLWRIFDMTGRGDWCEPIFRQLYEIGPPERRVDYLRDWYLSQNDPAYITESLDEMLGFRESPAENGRRLELKRLVAFRQAEPREPWLQAAVAQWFLEEKDLEQSQRIVTEARSLPGALEDPRLVSVLTNVLIEAGQFEDAAMAFDRWPEPHDDYAYWKTAGLLQENLHRNYVAASAAYAKAVAIWPGQADWRTQSRLAACLALSGEKGEAETVRQHATEVQHLYWPDHRERRHRALSAPFEDASRELLINFYRTLQRPDEMKYWEQLTAQPPA